MEFLHSGAWPIIVFGGFAVGFLVGLTGVGAGSLMTPFLISGIGVPPVMAVGTDLLFASITKASAAWRHHSLGNVNWPIVRWLATGSLPGAAVVLAWIYLAAPDVHVLAGIIREVLAFALVVSALCVAAYPLLKRYAMAAFDPAELSTSPRADAVARAGSRGTRGPHLSRCRRHRRRRVDGPLPRAVGTAPCRYRHRARSNTVPN